MNYWWLSCVSDDFLLLMISEIFLPLQKMFQKHWNIDYTKKIYWHLERYKVNKIKLAGDSGEFFNIFKKITFKVNLQGFILRLWESVLFRMSSLSVCLLCLLQSQSMKVHTAHTLMSSKIMKMKECKKKIRNKYAFEEINKDYDLQ